MVRYNNIRIVILSLTLWEGLHVTTIAELLESLDKKQRTNSPQAWGSEKQCWKHHTFVVSIH